MKLKSNKKKTAAYEFQYATFPIQTHTQKASKAIFSPLFDSCSRTDRWTDGRTDRRTDKASYIVACPQLKKDSVD